MVYLKLIGRFLCWSLGDKLLFVSNVSDVGAGSDRDLAALGNDQVGEKAKEAQQAQESQ